MNCSNCQTANPDDAKFCRECGQKLLLVCPNCRHENLPGSKFCNNCGFNLDDSGAKRLEDGGRAPILTRMMPPELAQKLESASAVGA
ncbi:MAG: zinc ribbon domain-containing protein, partial [Nitrospirota bacterium]